MIVVVGQPLYSAVKLGPVADGLPARIALEAAAHRRSVQLVGKAGEDSAGDAIVLSLARAGVGHVALLREAGRPTPRVEPSGERLDVDGPLAEAVAMVDGPTERQATFAEPDGAMTLEAADVDLALRYLTDFAVLVVADRADPELIRVAAAAASWADARLIVVLPAGEHEPTDLPPDAIVFEAPEADPDGVFAATVGSFAAALDAGDDPTEAFRSTIAAEGWTASSEEAGTR